MSADKPVFILGVGSQKAGTTFLHHALSKHPAVAMSNPKELHVFNNVYVPGYGNYNERTRREMLRELLQTPPYEQSVPDRRKTLNLLRIAVMQYDQQEYVRYFKVMSRRKGIRCVGEITPEYQLLSAEHFREVRELLEPHFKLKIVFLMRDPIDRAFSALRMQDRNHSTKALAHERFGNLFRKEPVSTKSQYEKVIASLDEAFDATQVHYEFYEDLFQPESFARIGHFLGLDGLSADFEEKINASPTHGKPDEKAIAEAREFFAPTYDFCMQRFGAERVRKLWKRC